MNLETPFLGEDDHNGSVLCTKNLSRILSVIYLGLIVIGCDSKSEISRRTADPTTNASENVANDTSQQEPNNNSDGNSGPSSDDIFSGSSEFADGVSFSLSGNPKTMYGILNHSIYRWDPKAKNDQGSWSKVTDPVPNGDLLQIGSSYIMRSEKEIYVTVRGSSSRQIMRWNGASWEVVTPVTTNMLPSLRLSPSGELYAIVGRSLSYWNENTSTWKSFGPELPINHYIYDFAFDIAEDGTFITYGMVWSADGYRIFKLDPDSPEWTAVSDQVERMGSYFHLSKDRVIYANSRTHIVKWKDGQWTNVTEQTPTSTDSTSPMEIESFTFLGENEVYAELSDFKEGKVAIHYYVWDGAKWNKKNEHENVRGISFESHKILYAANGKKISSWDTTQKAWIDASSDAPGDIQHFQYVGSSRFYALLADGDLRQIYLYEGDLWKGLTPPIQNMKSKFFVTNFGMIYGVVSDKLSWWNKELNNWEAVGVLSDGITFDKEFKVVSMDKIYALVTRDNNLKQIFLWDGKNWQASTEPQESMASSLEVSEFKQLYSSVRRQISRWDVAHKTWRPISKQAPESLSILSFHFISATEIYTVLAGDSEGLQIGVWDGKSWYRLVPPQADLRPSIHRSGG